MTIQELKPLDIFATYKVSDLAWWPPSTYFEYLTDRGILYYGKKVYPQGITDVNHIRVFVGHFNEIPIAFEWTFPKARFVVVEDWMLDPNYCRLYRYSGEFEHNDWLMSEFTMNYFRVHEGSKYDWLQLGGILLNAEWIQLSNHREVCSTGARKAQESLLKTRNLFPEVSVWETPPCAWANSPCFTRVNGGRKKERAICLEPGRLATYDTSTLTK